MRDLGFLLIGQAIVFLYLLPGILAWGKEGHYAVCKIAEGLLSEDATAAVKVLLPESAQDELASVCSWADEIRRNFHWRWSAPLHYVDTPDFKCTYDYCRDCHDSAGKIDRCVSGAIYNYSSQLVDYQNPTTERKYNLTEALMFLSHFIGDIHQPLHVGFVGDEGGNTIIVRWYRRKTNLHHVWDNMIIESAMKDYYNSSLDIMIQDIQNNMEDEWSLDISSWENCAPKQTVCPDPPLNLLSIMGHDSFNRIPSACHNDTDRSRRYATESVKLACQFAYRNATPGSTLTDDYFLSRLPVVKKRLAQAGVRLAATLNRIFTPQQLISLRR